MKISLRADLDALLADPKNSFLLLFGKENDLAQAIHDKTKTCVSQKWRITVLIEDVTLLKEDEKSWFKSADQYTTLAPKATSAGKRRVVEQKTLSELCDPPPTPAARKIQAAFARADAARGDAA
jgi:hypothetical protein